MKIVFLKRVPGKGEKDQVKDIADGYARNFLIPQGFAAPATAERLRRLEAERQAHETEDSATVKRLTELGRNLEAATLVFTLKGDDQGSVFGSINKDQILKALREQGLATHDRVEIALEHPLKAFGDHKVKVNFHKGIEATLNVRVSREI